MLMYLIYTTLVSLFQPREVTLTNIKLKGYWMIVEEYAEPPHQVSEDTFRVIRFKKCKKATRKAKQCTFEWDIFDASLKENPKELKKNVKELFSPEGNQRFWIECQKINKEWHDSIFSDSGPPARFFLKKKNVTIHHPSDTTQVMRLKKIR